MKSQDVKYIKVKLLWLKYRWVARLPEIKLFLSSMTFSCCIQRLCLFSCYLTSQQHLCQSISLSSWIHFLHLTPRAHTGFPPISLFFLRSLLFSRFHFVHGVPKARMLKSFAIPFSSGPRFVRTLHHNLSNSSGPTWHSCIELDKAVIYVIS